MNGAEALVRTLVDGGVDLCLANPGTSEMHLVQAIDAVDGMRPVLTLFEGVATGAADGYGRMRGRPAATLLHLVRVSATALQIFTTPVARQHPCSTSWVIMHVIICPSMRRSRQTSKPLPGRFPPGCAARGAPTAWLAMAQRRSAPRSHLLPARRVRSRRSWCRSTACMGRCCGPGARCEGAPLAPVSTSVVERVAALLGDATVMLLDGDALTRAGRLAAGRIAEKTGCRVMATTFPARIEAGPICRAWIACRTFLSRAEASAGRRADRARRRGCAGELLCLSRRSERSRAGGL